MFKEYETVRGSVSLSKNTLKTIKASGQICNNFGVNGKLSFIHQLYNQNDLSFLANVGVLQQPILDKENFRDLNKKTALFSHNTQQEEINSVDIHDESAGFVDVLLTYYHSRAIQLVQFQLLPMVRQLHQERPR